MKRFMLKGHGGSPYRWMNYKERGRYYTMLWWRLWAHRWDFETVSFAIDGEGGMYGIDLPLSCSIALNYLKQEKCHQWSMVLLWRDLWMMYAEYGRSSWPKRKSPKAKAEPLLRKGSARLMTNAGNLDKIEVLRSNRTWFELQSTSFLSCHNLKRSRSGTWQAPNVRHVFWHVRTAHVWATAYIK